MPVTRYRQSIALSPLLTKHGMQRRVSQIQFQNWSQSCPAKYLVLLLGRKQLLVFLRLQNLFPRLADCLSKARFIVSLQRYPKASSYRYSHQTYFQDMMVRIEDMMRPLTQPQDPQTITTAKPLTTFPGTVRMTRLKESDCQHVRRGTKYSENSQ